MMPLLIILACLEPVIAIACLYVVVHLRVLSWTAKADQDRDCDPDDAIPKVPAKKSAA
jgi:hypothetical protein